MSEEARSHLSHHLNNSLTCIYLSVELGDLDAIRDALDHIVDDLNRVGIRSGSTLKRFERLNGLKGGGGS